MPDHGAHLFRAGRETFREAVCFESQEHALFGMVHEPGERRGQKRPGVLILHGFVGSKDQPHRVFVNLAEKLARAGIISLRFDLRGRGDSEGESIDITPAGDLADARAGLEFLAGREGVDREKLAVVGMSWGGVLACQLASDVRVQKVALWSCAPTQRLDWRPKLRPVGDRMAADEWGNFIGSQFYEGLAAIRLLEALLEKPKPVLLAYGTSDKGVARDIPAAREAIEKAGAKVAVEAIEGADHAFMSADWDRALVEATAKWLAV